MCRFLQTYVEWQIILNFVRPIAISAPSPPVVRTLELDAKQVTVLFSCLPTSRTDDFLTVPDQKFSSNQDFLFIVLVKYNRSGLSSTNFNFDNTACTKIVLFTVGQI